MHDTSLLHVLKTFSDLSNKLCHFRLRKQLLLTISSWQLLDEVIKFLALKVLHQDINVLLVFEECVQLNNLLAFQLSMNLNLLLYPLH